MSEKMKSPDKKEYERCQEYCDGNIAIFYCPQCLTNYCADCYDKEHKLKRRKENHVKVSTPRKVCREHHLTLEYQNKSRYMCCMCVKELPPGELARNNIEPIDGVATVFKEKLEERVRELELVSQAINKKLEASNESISSAIECARSEVRRFFTALNLLLNKQEESFQHQLTCLLHATTSKAVFSEMKQTLTTAEELLKEGKALLCEDNLIVAKKFDHISREIDELLVKDNIKKFPSPTLNVSINVHRHLLEMVRHPGYISTTFDECREPGNVICKSEMKSKNIDETMMKEKEDIRETFPTPPQIPICSPPMSVTGEDEDTPYSLMPQYSRNSSPFFLSPDEDTTLRPFAVNNVNDKDLDNEKTRSSLCSCSDESFDTMTEARQVSQQAKSEQDVHQMTEGKEDFRRKWKENNENKNGKRKTSQNNFFLSFSRKSRRTEASKELNQCDKILTELWVSDDSFPFARPVDHKKVPEYYEVIKNPIDLTTIKTKLQSITYDSVYDFVDDMKLLFENCYLFNPTSSVTFESGVKLEKQFMKLMRQNFPSLYYESNIPENNISQEKTS